MAALGEERRGALLRLANFGTHDPDGRELETVYHPDQRPTEERHRQTWGERADQCRRHVAEIDAEITRVTTKETHD